MGSGVSLAYAIRENAKTEILASVSLDTRKAFVDEEFPPNVISISTYDQILITSVKSKKILWLRPHEFGCGELISGKDFTGEDCSTHSNPCLGIAASLLSSRPDIVQSLFVFYNKGMGCAGVRLWYNCKPEIVVVDDLIPCTRETSKPIFSFLFNGDCWLCLLEKAMAKLFGSYYAAMSMASVENYLHDITGESVTRLSLLQSENANRLLMDSLIARLQQRTVLMTGERLVWLNSSQGDCEIDININLKSAKSETQICSILKYSVDHPSTTSTQHTKPLNTQHTKPVMPLVHPLFDSEHDLNSGPGGEQQLREQAQLCMAFSGRSDTGDWQATFPGAVSTTRELHSDGVAMSISPQRSLAARRCRGYFLINTATVSDFESVIAGIRCAHRRQDSVPSTSEMMADEGGDCSPGDLTEPSQPLRAKSMKRTENKVRSHPTRRPACRADYDATPLRQWATRQSQSLQWISVNDFISAFPTLHVCLLSTHVLPPGRNPQTIPSGGRVRHHPPDSSRMTVTDSWSVESGTDGGSSPRPSFLRNPKFRIIFPHSKFNLAGAKLVIQLTQPDKRDLWHRYGEDPAWDATGRCAVGEAVAVFDDERTLFPVQPEKSAVMSADEGEDDEEGEGGAGTGTHICDGPLMEDDQDESLTNSDIARAQQQKRSRMRPYLPISMTVFDDEPTLRTVLAHAPLVASRNAALEFVLSGNMQSVVVVANTDEPGTEGEFRLTGKLLLPGAELYEAVSIHRITAWPQYGFQQSVRGVWDGISAGGRVTRGHSYSGLNPAWRMVVHMGRSRDAAVDFRFAVFLSHSAARGSSSSNSSSILPTGGATECLNIVGQGRNEPGLSLGQLSPTISVDTTGFRKGVYVLTRTAHAALPRSVLRLPVSVADHGRLDEASDAEFNSSESRDRSQPDVWRSIRHLQQEWKGEQSAQARWSCHDRSQSIASTWPGPIDGNDAATEQKGFLGRFAFEAVKVYTRTERFQITPHKSRSSKQNGSSHFNSSSQRKSSRAAQVLTQHSGPSRKLREEAVVVADQQISSGGAGGWEQSDAHTMDILTLKATVAHQFQRSQSTFPVGGAYSCMDPLADGDSQLSGADIAIKAPLCDLPSYCGGDGGSGSIEKDRGQAGMCGLDSTPHYLAAEPRGTGHYASDCSESVIEATGEGLRDGYREFVLMPATWDSGQEAEFEMCVMSNLPVDLIPIHVEPQRQLDALSLSLATGRVGSTVGPGGGSRAGGSTSVGLFDAHVPTALRQRDISDNGRNHERKIWAASEFAEDGVEVGGGYNTCAMMALHSSSLLTGSTTIGDGYIEGSDSLSRDKSAARRVIGSSELSKGAGDGILDTTGEHMHVSVERSKATVRRQIVFNTALYEQNRGRATKPVQYVVQPNSDSTLRSVLLESVQRVVANERTNFVREQQLPQKAPAGKYHVVGKKTVQKILLAQQQHLRKMHWFKGEHVELLKEQAVLPMSNLSTSLRKQFSDRLEEVERKYEGCD